MGKVYLSFILSGKVRMLLNYLSSISIVLLILTVAACGSDKVERMKIPGNPKLNDYGIRFKIDWDVFESGSFVYGSDNHRSPHMGGRLGYLDFYTLILDFKFKDGREYHEEIDIKPLIQKMLKKHKIFDLKTSKWGGRVALTVTIEKDKLAVDYQVSEYVKKGNPIRHLSKRYFFPIFEKILD